MELKNYMEIAVEDNLDRMLSRRNDFCSCERCRLDVSALALNRLPQRYVVTDKGRVMTKIKETEVQCQADILRELVIALEIVKSKPRHDY
ncbi:MAG: late competence development ComFB family protein [Candidatus Omnitrophota bacterium]